MNDLTITLLTASVLGLMFIWLSTRVISARLKNEVLIGLGDGPELQWAIRIHGNFTEYVPIFLIVLGLLELSGGHRTTLATLAILFVVARASHVVGMGPEANLKFRQAGVLGSFTAVAGASLYGLYIGIV